MRTVATTVVSKNCSNPAVSGNDEISPGVSWRLTRAARYPLDPSAIAYFLRLGNWLISKVRVSGLDRARDAIDLIAAIIDAPGLVEHTIFGEDLFDCRAGSFSPKTSLRLRVSKVDIL